MKVKKLSVLVPAAAVLLLLLLAAACGTGGVTLSTRAPARAAVGAASQPAPAVPGSAQSASGVASTAPSDVAIQAQVPEGPRVQRSARVALQVASGHFDSALNDVIAIVDQAGGYISGSQAQADTSQVMRSGEVTFQVPAARFDDVLTQIRKKGTPQTISISGNDVSLQYVDLQARLANAEAQRSAMLALLQQAGTVNDMIQIQNQLGQIEQLKGQISYLDHSTTYATVSVSITETTAATTDEWGLRPAFIQALYNFVGAVDFVILALGTLAPIVISGLVLWFAGRWALVRYRRYQMPRPATGGGPAE
jgi:hypothetical protein